MSQKAYMWNRSNPYAYSDPSGFAPTGSFINECGSSAGLGYGGFANIEGGGGGWGPDAISRLKKRTSAYESHAKELGFEHNIEAYADMAAAFEERALHSVTGFLYIELADRFLVFELATKLLGVYGYDTRERDIITFFRVDGNSKQAREYFESERRVSPILTTPARILKRIDEASGGGGW